jgi:hypothetical protein
MTATTHWHLIGFLLFADLRNLFVFWAFQPGCLSAACDSRPIQDPPTDTIYGYGLFFEIQNCLYVIQCLLAND